jgi:hypothetical protein
MFDAHQIVRAMWAGIDHACAIAWRKCKRFGAHHGARRRAFAEVRCSYGPEGRSENPVLDQAGEDVDLAQRRSCIE